MKRNSLSILVLFVLLVIGGIVINRMYLTDNRPQVTESVGRQSSDVQQPTSVNAPSVDIDRLTQQGVVVNYLRQNNRLPDYYITKNKARSQGWDARDGNLCRVLPGKAIGGDRFSNREGTLPEAKGRIWFEADINYRCGHRGADRLLYSSDGLIYVTHNHYKRFTEVKN
ncbi:ribonuclease domain-containing protein [Budvicia diplopodorum]|uniref:ribonuclease domain-containing protein n=1 Tax=Budvicia diplopodorum TaxID=1119056 RepID=UPI00135BD02B|nr:ribonuclease domain-containing protein [Budvicia diplopodorum]